MSTYLVTMTPLEPFTFGGERGFGFADDNRAVSYYQSSKEMPEQTTVLGMLRYLVLKNKGLLKDFSEYSDEDRVKIAEMIGAQSFSFRNKRFQMGKLERISPVFIVDHGESVEDRSYYIRNPLNYINDKGYESLKMSEETVCTSAGMIQLPENYTTKTELLDGYVKLGGQKTTKAEYAGSLFYTVMYTGNRKNEKENVSNAYFKREAKSFQQKDLAFAVFVECEENLLPPKEIAGMGLKKSAFLVETEKVEKNDLIERVQSAFSGEACWFYALSDLVSESFEIRTFSVIGKKQIRTLQTRLDKKSFRKAVCRDQTQYNVISAGSVFYGQKPLLDSNENLEKAGYNQIVKIGGDQHASEII